MTLDLNWVNDLQTEKSIYQCFVKSLRFKRSRFNQYARGVIAVLTASSMVIISLQKGEPIDIVEPLKFLADSTFILGITILAFLAAGFTIFTTLSDRQILVELAKTTQPSAGVSSFKYLFFNFLSVFALYIFGVSASLFIGVLIRFNLPSIALFCINRHAVYSITNGICMFFLSIITSEMILKLKSFVWNIYSTFITLLLAPEIMRR